MFASKAAERLTIEKLNPEEVKYVLAHFSSNWADEMDIDGLALFTVEEWNEYYQEICDRSVSNDWDTRGKVIYVGTNQYLEYSDPKDYLDEITLYKLDEAEYNTFMKFTSGGFGKFIYILDYL